MKMSAMRQLLRIERAFMGSAYAETYSDTENAVYADECARSLSNAWMKLLEGENRQWAARAAAYEEHAIEIAEHAMHVAEEMAPGRMRSS